MVGLVVSLQYRIKLSGLSVWRKGPIPLLRTITLLGYGRTKRMPNRAVLPAAKSGKCCLATASPKCGTCDTEAEDHHAPSGGFWDSTD